MILNDDDRDLLLDLYCNLCVYSFLLARDCDGSFSHIDARMNVQRSVFSMLILVLDMAIRGAFRSKDTNLKIRRICLRQR